MDLTQMFEENEILTQIRALRHEVGSRLDDMDQRLRKIEAEVSAPAIQNHAARLEEMEQRLNRMELHLTGPAAGAVASPGAINGSVSAGLPAPQVELAPPVPTTDVQVTINPLLDVSHVRVVEAALAAIDGVEAVSLQTLSGDTAELQVKAQEGVSLIGGLRRTLPLAFDVSESDSSSFTVALVQAVADVPAPAQTQHDVVVREAK
ncbi:MAG TPA: hypothetical protein VIJ21_03915 [Solirubrobacterales bacterium]